MYDNDKLKIYYDAEFTGLRHDTSLISIGLVSESGNWFYAEFTDYDKTQVDDWLQEHVINNLCLKTVGANFIPIPKEFPRPYCITILDTTENIKNQLIHWLYTESTFMDKQIQIYCDCYAYDWMLFNKLLCDDGLALNLPEYIYYIPMDLSTALQFNGIDPDITREEYIGKYVVEQLQRSGVFNMSDNCKHNSLWDAAVCMKCFTKLLMN